MRYKVIVLGEYGTGKSAFVDQLLYARIKNCYSVTVGIEYGIKTMDDGTIFDIWDTAGQERYRNIVRGYYRNVDVVIYMYDRTEPCTFERVTEWIEDFNSRRSTGPPLYTVLLGNKSDLRCMVTDIQGKDLAKSQGIDCFMNISSKNHQETLDVFDAILEGLRGKAPNKNRTELSITGSSCSSGSSNWSCCGAQS